jgi:hypothetical protein
MKNQSFIVVVVLVLVLQGAIMAQNSVSIGTQEINENAVLQLVSPANNQGFLVPKLTTAQRLAMNLQNKDDALLVFDSDLGTYFFWYNSSWIQLSNRTDADTDPLNEIQDLQLIGDTLTITNNPAATNIDLSGYLDNTDDQNLSEVLTEGNDAGNAGITNLANPVNPQDATTKAYVDNRMPAGAIIMWSGSIASIPTGWALCDGTNGTPNLTDRFVRSVGTQNPGGTGGNVSQIHSHTVNNHQHTVDPPETNLTDYALGWIISGFLGWEYMSNYNCTPHVNIPQFNSGSQTAPVGTDAQNHYPLYYVLAFIMKL